MKRFAFLGNCIHNSSWASRFLKIAFTIPNILRDLREMNLFKAAPELNKPALAVIPKHIAIVMDGNGRWAKSRNLPRTAGHRAGMERALEAVETCLAVGVEYLTLYAFSTENWRRPPEEVSFIMKLFEEAFQEKVREMHEKGVRIRFIGLQKGLSPRLIRIMEDADRLTGANQNLTVNIAFNYGGRSELVAAAQQLIREVLEGRLRMEDITEDEFGRHLFTAGQPDPDLLIKPGREFRISNFLIWQLAYTEFYFSETLWPDFGRTEMFEAIRWFGTRERRFGRVEAVKGRQK